MTKKGPALFPQNILNISVFKTQKNLFKNYTATKLKVMYISKLIYFLLQRPTVRLIVQFLDLRPDIKRFHSIALMMPLMFKLHVPLGVDYKCSYYC
jgi:hypothetical protein